VHNSKYVRSPERWIRAAQGQAQICWHARRWVDYEAACLDLGRLAEASGRHELEVGILGCVYGDAQR
jgi:hypothetical protein